MNVARMLSRKSFRLSTFFVVFTIAAIGLYGVSRYIAAPRLTKFTTGGIRSDGYKWCVVCSGNQPVVVFVDYDKFSESDATWYRSKCIGTGANSRIVFANAFKFIDSKTTTDHEARRRARKSSIFDGGRHRLVFHF